METEMEKSDCRPDWEGFGRELLEGWPDDVGSDGFHIQDLAVKHGLLHEVPGGFDPAIHVDTTGAAEPGDQWFIPSFPAEREPVAQMDGGARAILKSGKYAYVVIDPDGLVVASGVSRFDSAAGAGRGKAMDQIEDLVRSQRKDVFEGRSDLILSLIPLSEETHPALEGELVEPWAADVSSLRDEVKALQDMVASLSSTVMRMAQ